MTGDGTAARVRAWQHLYGNVEKDRSPTGKGGFQTLLYSREGLSEDEIGEIEERLVYKPSEDAPAKKVFFPIGTGKVVLGRMVGVEGADSAGRGGRYLGHVLVFERADFDALGGDAIGVFREFPFLETIEDALAAGDAASGDVPAVEIPRPAAASPPEGAAWSGPGRKTAILLGLQANALTDDRTTILVRGEADAIDAALAAMLEAVPTALRTRCTFDTYFHRGNLAATYFWGIGLPKSEHGPGTIELDADARSVRGADSLAVRNAYEAWALAAVDSGQLDGWLRERDRAWALATLVDTGEGQAADLEGADDALVTSMVSANAPRVDEAIRRRIGEHAPAELLALAFGGLREGLGPREALERVRVGFERDVVVGAIWAGLTTTPPPDLGRGELKAVAELARAAGHGGLAARHAALTRDDKRLGPALGALSDEDYRTLVRSLLHAKVEPATLAVPGRGALFLELLLGRGPTERGKGWEIDALAETLIGLGEGASLTALTPAVARREPREIRALAGVVDEHPDLPPAFAEAVRQAAAAHPSLVQRLGRSLGGLFRKKR